MLVGAHVEATRATETAEPRRELQSPELLSQTPFSPGWVKAFVSDPVGCSSWRTVGYAWDEDCGLATNLNS